MGGKNELPSGQEDFFSQVDDPMPGLRDELSKRVTGMSFTDDVLMRISGLMAEQGIDAYQALMIVMEEDRG